MEFLKENLNSLWMFKPEITLIAGIIVIFIVDLVLKNSRKTVLLISFICLLMVAYFSSGQFSAGQKIFGSFLAVDGYSSFFKLLFVAVTGLTLLIIKRSREFEGAGIAEIAMLLFTITLGMMLLASATDLLIIYISLETVSLLSYALVGYMLDNKHSSEASLKYVIFGGVSSGIMLFGMTYLYGMFGTTNIFELKNAITGLQGSSYPLMFSFMLVFVGFGFKMAMVPFHMWCPDVYEGAPTPITAFLSVGPKAAGFAVFMRFIFTVFDAHNGFVPIFTSLKLPALIIVLSVITMTVGNLAAIPQNNLKRLLAYSSIAHAGYLLMGFAALNREGLSSVLFYLPIYLVMNFGAFLIVIAVRDATSREDMNAYRGLGKRNPFLAVSMAVFLFSLTGLPPLAGFLGKFYLFAAVIHKGLYLLAVIGVLNSVVSLFYYMRVVKAMFIEGFSIEHDNRKENDPLIICNLYNILISILLFANLALIVSWSPLLKIIEKSLVMIF